MEKLNFQIDDEFEGSDIFKNIFRSIKIPIMIVGLDGKIKFFTPYYKKILGDLNLHIGMNFLEYIHPDDIEILKNLFQKGVKQRKSYLLENFEFRIKKSDGNYAWVSTHTESYYNNQKELKGFVSVLSDITQKKVLEHKHTELQRELKKININKNSSKSINLSLNDLNKALEGICSLFNVAFDPNEILFWIGIENLSVLFKTFVKMLLESAGFSEIEKKIRKIDLNFKVTDDGQGYLELSKN